MLPKVQTRSALQKSQSGSLCPTRDTHLHPHPPKPFAHLDTRDLVIAPSPSVQDPELQGVENFLELLSGPALSWANPIGLAAVPGVPAFQDLPWRTKRQTPVLET